ncbi:MAG: MFS transporter [Rhodospirillaceae bacterium]
MTLASYRSNIFLLATAQGMFFINRYAFVAFAGLAGQMLASDKLLATMPMALVTAGTAAVTIPLSLMMKRTGRRPAFLLGALSGVVGGGICAYAVWIQSFELLCVAALVLGTNQAASQYYRFAAIEVAPATHLSRAISTVLAGAVIAALLAPTMARYSESLFAPATFVGGFMLIAVISVVSMIPLGLMTIPMPKENHQDAPMRPMLEIMKQPAFAAAVMNSACSYGLMSSVMAAAPIAMVACGFSVSDAGSVIQWHLLAMFVPSFFTGRLVDKWGVLPILYSGLALFVIAGAFAISGIGLGHFGAAMICLGVGWNFLYVGGTTLLTEAHTPGEKAKVQGINEFLVFGSTVIGTAVSGGLLNLVGWDAVNYGMAPFLSATLIATLWYTFSRRGGAAAGASPA